MSDCLCDSGGRPAGTEMIRPKDPGGHRTQMRAENTYRNQKHASVKSTRGAREQDGRDQIKDKKSE